MPGRGPSLHKMYTGGRSGWEPRPPATSREGMTRDRTSLLSEPAGLPTSASTESAAALALPSVYASQRDFVWLTLQRMGVRRSDLEDVFQDVFMVVHKRLDSYR